MSSPRDKPPPPKAEDDFSDLNVELADEPTSKFPALNAQGAVAARRTPETMPAPPDAPPPPAPVHRASGPAAAGPQRSPSRDDIRKRATPYGASVTRPRSETPLYAPSPSPDKWRDAHAADEPFTEPTTRKPAMGPARADTDEFGRPVTPNTRPTREAPPGEPAAPASERQTAPRPPRIPTIDPLAEFAFGFEPEPGDTPTPALPHDRSAIKARGPRTEFDDPLASSDADLSWSDAEVTGTAQEPPGPTAPPLPAGSDLEGDAWSLVEKASRQPVAIAPPDPRRELNERFALGDFSGALVVAEALVAEGRADAHVERVAADCRVKLEQMYTARLGAITQVPSVAVPRSELKWLSLDHRAGFLLSLVDGASSIEEIIDVSGMPPLEVLRTLYELVGQKVIEFRGPPR